jgi:hypothetical protein
MNTPDPADAEPRTSRQPVGLDFSSPTIARIYDAFLGGTHNYEADRTVRDKLRGLASDIDAVFTSEIMFLHRAARWIAEKFPKLEQWVIAVPGPAPDGRSQIHDVIRQGSSDARIWYVDYEPVTLAYLRTFDDPHSSSRIHAVNADPLNPDAVWTALDDDQSTRPDDRPICLVLGGVLSYHHLSPAEAGAVTQRHIKHLPRGSFVVLTHLHDPEIPELATTVQRLRKALRHGPLGAGNFATSTEIEAMMAGTTILSPGVNVPPSVVPAYLWWRDGPALKPDPEAAKLVAAVVAHVPSG